MTLLNKSLTLLVVAVTLGTAISPAAARPDTRYMSCAAAVSIVQANGAVILSTGAHTYDKYVKNHAYCNLNDVLRKAYVPTSDTRRCRVGFVCKGKFDYSD